MIRREDHKAALRNRQYHQSDSKRKLRNRKIMHYST